MGINSAVGALVAKAVYDPMIASGAVLTEQQKIGRNKSQVILGLAPDQILTPKQRGTPTKKSARTASTSGDPKGILSTVATSGRGTLLGN